METVEADLQHLLAAEKLELGPIDLPANDLDYQPITKLNVAYIVCGIIINDKNEVLMMQEAKRSCHGMWYLPAGRIDPNETIQEAVKREVLEETGIEFEASTMIAVETCNAFWYRFVFIGSASGGTVKTLEKRDSESLQAKWCSTDTIRSGRKHFPLRASDILPLIDVALKHKAETAATRHPDLLPTVHPHTKVLLRVVCLYISQQRSDVQLLVGMKPCPHLPVAVIVSTDRNLDSTLHRLMETAFAKVKVERTIHGVLSVEYNGKPAQVHDGMCVSLMVSVETKDKQQPGVAKTDSFQWQGLQSDEIKQQLLNRKSVPLFVMY